MSAPAARAPRVAGVVLAAGRATRFGEGQKLLRPLHGVALVRRVVETALAAAVDEVLVVAGADGEAVAAAVAGLPVRVVVNPRFATGLGSSVAAAVAAVAALGEPVGAAVFLLGDQPTVAAAVVDALVGRWREGGASIVAPVYAGARGNPVLFDRRLFGALAALEGDEGGRQLLARHAAETAHVAFPFAMPPDVDTPEDLARLER